MADVIHDVFISYSHLDNAVGPEEEHGWITLLAQSLENRLSQLVGRQTSIFYDIQQRRDEELTAEIKAAIKTSGLFLTVVSPSYANSHWCKAELTLFFDLHQTARNRLIKVVKTPPRDDAFEALPYLAGRIGHDFYRLDKSKTPLEFDPKLGDDEKRAFYRTVNELAKAIQQKLAEMGGSPPPANRRPNTGIVIYVADTAFDVAPERENLRTTLTDLGHTVLPHAPLALRSDYPADVENALARCDVSIHLIGASYEELEGVTRSATEFEGTTLSAAEVQYEAAERQLGRPGYRRLSWMRRGVRAEGAQQTRFVRRLREDLDFVVGSLEDFKTHIDDVLAEKMASPKAAAAPRVSDESFAPPLAYVIFDREDEKRVKPVSDALMERGIDVFRTMFTKDEADIAAYHIQILEECDGILVYQGVAGDVWHRMKMLELRKALGYRRGRPFRSKAVLFGPPPTSEKDLFNGVGLRIIYCYDDVFRPEVLEPFIVDLSGDRGWRT